jgi:flavodoxin
MVGLYFSGTGNTEHCVEKFVHYFDPENQAISIEVPELDNILANEDIIIFGHPTCFSNAPKIVRDYIKNHINYFIHKKVFIIATMGLFSGDGAGCSARNFTETRNGNYRGLAFTDA